MTIKTDDVTSSRRDLDPHGRLRAARGRMGKKDSSWVVAFSTDTFGFIDKCAIKMPVLNQTKGVAHSIFRERTISHFSKRLEFKKSY